MAAQRRTVVLAGAVVLALVVAAVALVIRNGSNDDVPGTGDGAARGAAPGALVPMPEVGSTFLLQVTGGGGDPALTSVAEGPVSVVTDDGVFRSTEVDRADGTDGEWTANVSTVDQAGGAGPVLSVSVDPVAGGASSISIGLASEADADDEGVGDAEASGMTIDFVATDHERFYGLGQRATGVEHRGAEVENRVLDGPYTEVQIPVVGQVVPPAGFSERPDATYYPVPWVLSSEGYGVLVDDDEVSRFTFATDDAPDRWRAEVDADRLMGVDLVL